MRAVSVSVRLSGIESVIQVSVIQVETGEKTVVSYSARHFIGEIEGR
jgi:hypothetical protein